MTSNFWQTSQEDNIYASTVLKFIDDEDLRPTDQLETVMSLSRLNPTTGSTEDAFADLDLLYRQILSMCDRSLLLRILGCILVAVKDVSASELEDLLSLPHGDVGRILRRTHSLLRVPKEPTERIDVYHKSLADFTFNPDRAREYYMDPGRCHDYLAHQCLRLIQEKTDVMKAPYAYGQWSSHCLQACCTEELLFHVDTALAEYSKRFPIDDKRPRSFIKGAVAVWGHFKVRFVRLLIVFVCKSISLPAYNRPRKA
jgi:hypothetical protein